jgi:hypothetical protein
LSFFQLIGGMTTPSARDRGLRRLSDLTAWLGVGALALTGVFAGLVAHATHASTTTTNSGTVSVNSSGLSSTTGAGLAASAAPTASASPSHIRSGSS